MATFYQANVTATNGSALVEVNSSTDDIGILRERSFLQIGTNQIVEVKAGIPGSPDQIELAAAWPFATVTDDAIAGPTAGDLADAVAAIRSLNQQASDILENSLSREGDAFTDEIPVFGSDDTKLKSSERKLSDFPRALPNITSLSSLNTATLVDGQQFSVKDGARIRTFAWNESDQAFAEIWPETPPAIPFKDRAKNPFLSPNTKDIDAYKRTDLGSIIPAGASGEFDAYFRADPFAVVFEGKVYLFYEGTESGSVDGRIGCAVSTDGLNFTKHPDSPVVDDLTSSGIHRAYPSVVRDGDTFYMMTDGFDTATNESSAAMYRTDASSFPGGWVKVIDKGPFAAGGSSDDYPVETFVDPTLFFCKGVPWILYAARSTSARTNIYTMTCSAADPTVASAWTKNAENSNIPKGSRWEEVRTGGDIIDMGDGAFLAFIQANDDGAGNLYTPGQSVAIMTLRIGAGRTDYTAEMDYNVDSSGVAVKYLPPSNNPGTFDEDQVHHLSFVRFKGRWLGYYDGKAGSNPWEIGVIELPEQLP